MQGLIVQKVRLEIKSERFSSFLGTNTFSSSQCILEKIKRSQMFEKAIDFFTWK